MFSMMMAYRVLRNGEELARVEESPARGSIMEMVHELAEHWMERPYIDSRRITAVEISFRCPKRDQELKVTVQYPPADGYDVIVA